MAKPKKGQDEAPEVRMGVWDTWDTEQRVTELGSLEFRLTGTNMYIPAATKQQMDEDHGMPVTYVRTKTEKETGSVSIAAADAETEGARLIRPSDTLGTAEFGFSIPLRKLGLSLPATRQFVFPAERFETDAGWTYKISFSEFMNNKRQVDEAAMAAQKQMKREKMRAKKLRKAPPAVGEQGGQV